MLSSFAHIAIFMGCSPSAAPDRMTLGTGARLYWSSLVRALTDSPTRANLGTPGLLRCRFSECTCFVLFGQGIEIGSSSGPISDTPGAKKSRHHCAVIESRPYSSMMTSLVPELLGTTAIPVGRFNDPGNGPSATPVRDG